MPDGVYLGGNAWAAPGSTIGIYKPYSDSSCGDLYDVSFDGDGAAVSLDGNGLGWGYWASGYYFEIPVTASGAGSLILSCDPDEGASFTVSIPFTVSATAPSSTFHTPGMFTLFGPDASDVVTLNKVGYLPGESVTVSIFNDTLNSDADDFVAYTEPVVVVADGAGAITVRVSTPSEWSEGDTIGVIASSATSKLVYDSSWEDGFPIPGSTAFTPSASAPPGGSIAVSGTGFEPNETVVIALHSASSPAVVLGTKTANGSGAISGTVALPGGTALGEYRLWAGAKSIGYLLQSAPLVVEPQIFSDVANTTNSFYTFIQWMSQTGISTGTPQPSGPPLYKPVDTVSRQAMATFMYRLSGETFTAPSEPSFADVPTGASTFTAVEWMASKGISLGTPQPSGLPLFKPTDPVSRSAMALFLARYAGATLATPTTQSFSDVPTNASSAAAIEWMKSTGISTGTPASSGLPSYKPADAVSRQAMAAFLYRLDHLS